MNKSIIHSNICANMHNTYIKKNADYGDSFARTRNVVPFYTLGKLADKYNRIEHLMLSGQGANVDETIEDTLLDLANYCIMELTERQAEREAIADTIPEIEIDESLIDDLGVALND